MTNQTMRAALLGFACATLMVSTDAWAGRRGDDEQAQPLRQIHRTSPLAVRLTGTIEHGSRGFRLDGTALRFNDRTAFFPGASQRDREAIVKSLRGEVATIYGRRSAGGVDVVLVIVHGEGDDRRPTSFPDPRIPDPSTYTIPHPEVEGFGELTADAPN